MLPSGICWMKFSRKVDVYPPGTCPLTVQLSLLHASMNQTCGKCVPCRDGLPQLADLLSKILNGVGTMEMVDEMREIAIMIRDTADCAIGYQSAIEVLEGLETFADEYESHVKKMGMSCQCRSEDPMRDTLSCTC